MREYRCENPHPRRLGPCNHKFFEGEFLGTISILCEGCGRVVAVREDASGTDVDAIDVVRVIDKGGSLVYV